MINENMLFLLVVFVLFYFLPYAIARSRHHHNAEAIGALNLLLGWTLVGWVIAVIWASTAVRIPAEQPTSETHVKCPDCKELILKDAVKCRFCGCRLTPPP